MLLGTYRHQLDQKNRFRIPAKLKASLGENFVLTKGTEGCLFLFSKKELEENIFNKVSNISIFDEKAQRPLRLLFSSAHDAEEDNQGRILLQAELKNYAEIEKNIVFVGVGRRVEVWSEEKWNRYSQGNDFDKVVKQLKDFGV